MVFLRNDVSLTWDGKTYRVYESGRRWGTSGWESSAPTCWMRTSFSSFTTLVSSSIWLDSCFVLMPSGEGALFAEAAACPQFPPANADGCFPPAGTVFLGSVHR